MKLIFVTILTISFALVGCSTKQSTPEKPYHLQQHRTTTPPKLSDLTDHSFHPQHAGPINDQYEPITRKYKKTVEILGFLDPGNKKRAVQNVKRFAPYLTYVGFFSYNVKADGSLVNLNDQTPLQATKKQQITPMMVITNMGKTNYSPEIAHALFTDQKATNRLIQNIITTMRKKGFRALNIDFESLAKNDKYLYNNFLKALVPMVKSKGYLVSTDLAPKTSDEQQGPWVSAHDYAFHGQITDFVVLMTYDWAYSTGPPSAIAPTPEIEKVLTYAVSKIPSNKIMMGFPLYGYDWHIPYSKKNPPAKLVSPQEAITIAQNTGASIHYDNQAEVPFFTYKVANGAQHEVWFENEQSAQAKFNLVKKYQLRGIGYWAISHRDFSRNWTLLHENFLVHKY